MSRVYVQITGNNIDVYRVDRGYSTAQRLMFPVITTFKLISNTAENAHEPASGDLGLTPTLRDPNMFY